MKTTSHYTLLLVLSVTVLACSPKTSTVRGTILDLSAHSLTMLSDEGDTLLFDLSSIAPPLSASSSYDSVSVLFSGKYRLGQSAKEIVLRHQTLRPGSDRDEHGCIGSAGYTWSEVRHDCIRLFEEAIRLKATDGNESAFLLPSADSSRIELFFIDGRTEIVCRHDLPGGTPVWYNTGDAAGSVEVHLTDNIWSVHRDGETVFRQ